MKMMIKKHISLLLAALMIISTAAIAVFFFFVDSVEINEINFPDETFRNAIAYMYDIDSDGFLSKQERNVDSMIVSGIIEMYAFENDLDEDNLSVNNLKGIEFFENLKSLRCSGIGKIDYLDLSGLNNLETLACNDLGMKELNLSDVSNLKVVNCCSNDFTSLDFSNNANLERIHCYENSYLKSVNVTGLGALKDFRCDNCALENINLSTNANLEYLNCSYNHLYTLDLSANTKLVSDGRDITEYNIGFQSGEAQATARGSMIIVPFELDSSKVASTSLDVDGNVAHTDNFFYTDNFDNMQNGLTYYYKTGVSESAYMSVVLNVTEKEHSYVLSGFDFDGNNAHLECVICKNEKNVSFVESINAREDDESFIKSLDVTDDGIVNAKDFAAILNEYK